MGFEESYCGCLGYWVRKKSYGWLVIMILLDVIETEQH